MSRSERVEKPGGIGLRLQQDLIGNPLWLRVDTVVNDSTRGYGLIEHHERIPTVRHIVSYIEQRCEECPKAIGWKSIAYRKDRFEQVEKVGIYRSTLPNFRNSPGGPMRMLNRMAEARKAKAAVKAMASEAISGTPK